MRTINKQSIYNQRFPMGSFRKFSLFNLGNVWDFVEKALNFNVFTHIFGIFGLWIHFSIKYIKTIVKIHKI